MPDMRIVSKRGVARLTDRDTPHKQAKWWHAHDCNTASTGVRGLGDVVAIFAEPVAKVIGLDKSKCGCQRRQDWLNEKVPFGNG